METESRVPRAENGVPVDWESLLNVDDFRGPDILARKARLAMQKFMGVVWQESKNQDGVVLDDGLLRRVENLFDAADPEQEFTGLYSMCLSLRPWFGMEDEMKEWIGKKSEVYVETAERVLGLVWNRLKEYEWAEMPIGLQKFYRDEAEDKEVIYLTDSAVAKARAAVWGRVFDAMRSQVGLKPKRKGKGRSEKKLPSQIPEVELSYNSALLELMRSGLFVGKDSDAVRGMFEELSSAIGLFRETVEVSDGVVVKSMADRWRLRDELWGNRGGRLVLGFAAYGSISSIRKSQGESDSSRLEDLMSDETLRPLEIPLLKIVKK